LANFPWGCVIRASPHSLELLQDISQASFDLNALKTGHISPENCHNILQWLKVGNNTAMSLASSALNNFQAFLDPPQDVIEVWEQYLIIASKHYEDKWQRHPQYDLERWWRQWHANFEKWFPHLRGQTSGK
jgi:hypothetical protein